MVTEGIVLGYKISAARLEVDQASFYHKNSLTTYNSKRDKKFPRTCWIL